MEPELTPRQTAGSSVVRTPDGWRMEIPAGEQSSYRLAQLDDYDRLARPHLPHAAPWTLSLRACVSAPDLPGTWGFGVWNDPMGFSLGFGGNPRQLPALPQTAWFMHASLPNWLSLMTPPTPEAERCIPANGFFAGTFRSPHIPTWLFTPGLLALPLFELRATSRVLRQAAGRIIRQDGAPIAVDVTQWHDYSIAWLDEGCMFSVDGQELLTTPVAPQPPLGLVIWIDNQYAAWTPEGRLGYGTLDNPAAWLKVEKVSILQK